MSDTPETDKYCGEDLWIGEPALVSSDFARKLERERNCYKSAVEVITKERDEAREALREIHELLQRDAAWDTPNNVSRSLVMIEHICDWALQKEAAK